MQSPNNYAFIDSQNLNLAIQGLGWKLDFTRFHRYLEEKYHVKRAYLFLGYIEANTELYQSLEKAGFQLIYKPTLEYKDGTIKGNIDAELVLQVMIDYHTYDQAVLVTGDGDFFSLAEHLIRQHKLAKLLVPNQYRYSSLLKDLDSGHLAFISDLRSKLEYKPRRHPVKRKEPREDGNSEGA